MSLGSELEKAVRDLRSEDLYLREKASEFLIKNPTALLAEELFSLLEDEDVSVRMASLEVIKKIGGVFKEKILELFSHPSEDVRVYACEIVSELKIKEAIPYLLRAQEKDTETVKILAITALGEFNDERVVDALIRQIYGEEWVSFSAISSLAKIKSKKSLRPLLDVLKSGNDFLSICAIKALLEFEDRDVNRLIFEEIDAIDEERRNIFLRVILETGNKELIEETYKRYGASIVPILRELILDERKRDKGLIEGLKFVREREVVEILIKILSEIGEESDEYEFISSILAEMKELWADDLFLHSVRDKEILKHFLAAAKFAGVKLDERLLASQFMEGPPEVKRFIISNLEVLCENGEELASLALKDLDGHVRGYACEYVGKRRLREFEYELVKILESDYPDVRIKALKALISIDRERAKTHIERLLDAANPVDLKVYLAISPLLSGEENYPYVLKILSKPEGKKIALQVIGEFVEEERYRKLLEETLDGEEVPHEALRIIKDKRLRGFEEKLIRIFENSGNLWNRYFALGALSALEDQRFSHLFERALKDPNPLIRIAGIKGLTQLMEDGAIALIEPLLSDPDETVRMEAKNVLDGFAGYGPC